MTIFKQLRFLTVVATLGAIAVVGCASKKAGNTSKGESTQTVAVQKGVPGGVAVSTYTMTAKVSAVDKKNRKVTLVSKDGTKTQFKAGPDVRNFEQIHVGDQVKATLISELVVFLRKKGTPAQEGEASAIAVAPKGSKPGGIMINTVQMTAKVEALDLKRRQAKLRFTDGKSKTFPVRPDVDLTKVNLGDQVVIRNTEALALLVEKP